MNSKICEYLNCCKSKSFNETLFYYIDKSGHKDSEIYKRVDIDRRLFSKIRCDQDYIPRKNVIIKLCFSLRLSINSCANTNSFLLSALPPTTDTAIDASLF